MNTLPKAWEDSIEDWLSWLQFCGLSPATIRLRRHHLRMIARRSRTQHPAELTPGILIVIMTEYRWSKRHTIEVRTSLRSFCEWGAIRPKKGDLPLPRRPSTTSPSSVSNRHVTRWRRSWPGKIASP
jgi:hypothetical protein